MHDQFVIRRRGGMIDHGMINHIQRKMPSKEHIKLCRYVLERAQRNPTFIAIELCLDESCHAKNKKTCSKKERVQAILD